MSLHHASSFSTHNPAPKSHVKQSIDKTAYMQRCNFPFCQDIAKFVNRVKIGEGTYGEVYKAKDKYTNRQIAMKKIVLGNDLEGFPMTAIREVKILQLLRHENIVHLIEICRTLPTRENRFKSTFYLILEFCEHDLAGLLANKNVKFKLAEMKMIMKQLLDGLFYIHKNKILHRDLKPANILLTKSGTLKLADFGLARPFSVKTNGKENRLTNKVVTLWYRAPELLLGERNYGPPIDLWGAGCIMAEIWTRLAILQGTTEQHQLILISQLCGSFSRDVWPGVQNFTLFSKMELPKGLKRRVVGRLRPFIKDQHACDLLDRLLTLDPDRRIDSDSALNHDFFWTDPMPCGLEKMMTEHKHSMFQYFAQMQRPQKQEQPIKYQNNQRVGEDSGYQDVIF